MKNQKLSKALCIAAAAFLACGSGAVFAQKGTMFTPQGGWVTKDLASSKKGALPYCVAAKQFSKNTILTVAENKSGEISFAFDFGSGYFDPSVTARVVLDPGAGQQRAFNVKPRSSKAIVVKLGLDSAFFDALQRTGLLRMEVQDQSLNFNLSDIDVGREELGECLDGVIVVSAPNAVPPPNQDLRPANVEDSKLYQDMESAYEQKIKMLEAKLAKSEPELDKLATLAKVDPPKMVNVKSDRMPQALPQPSEVFPKNLPGLSDTSSDVAAKVAAVPMAVTKSYTKSDREKYEVLRAEYGQTKASLVSYQEKVLLLRARIEKLEAEKNMALASQRVNSDKVAQEQIEVTKQKELAQALLAENEALKVQVANLEGRYAQEVQDSELRYQALKKSYVQVQASLVAADKDLARLKTNLLESNSAEQEAVPVASLKSKEIDGKFEALLAEKKKVIALETERDVLAAKMVELEQDYKKLRGRHDVTRTDLENMTQSVAVLKAKLAQADVAQQSALARQAAKIKDNSGDHSEALLVAKKQVLYLESENTSLRAEVDALKSAYGKELAELRSDVAGARAGATAVSGLVDAPLQSIDQVSVPRAATREINISDAQLMEQDILNKLRRRKNLEPEVVVRPVPASYDDIPVPENVSMREVETVILPVQEKVEKSVAVSYASPAVGMMLQNAQVPVANEVSYVDTISTPVYQAYEWQTGQVFGSAEQHDGAKDIDFDKHVLSYLENTQKNCTGDFAIEPASSQGNGSDRVDSYDIACVGSNVSSSAAIVFYKDSGKFTAVAHEASVDNMEEAMSLRDRVVQALIGRESG